MIASIPPAARAELAPGGTLRVGINLGNFLLVNKDSASGNLSGIVIDLARELGRRAGYPVAFTTYPGAGALADAAKHDAWDVAFLGAEPARATEIAFTAAYLEIEATYLVPAGSAIRTLDEVDRDGVRIAVADKSAYDLFLKRSLKHARLVPAEGIAASYDLFVAQKLDALAGLKPRLVADAERLPGSRLLEGRFTAIQQAVGTPRARTAAAAWLGEFAEDIKTSGLVARLIADHRVRGVSVAPPKG